MENPEGVLNLLDDFAKLKSKEIPNDLEEYLLYVAASGDPVYQWSLIKSLYRQKLINVIQEFYEMCPVLDIPRCPNVDPFNYETMKNSLLKRLDSFSSAPFTIQRISELLTTPRKQYNRVDKFMRAIEKNIWVVSTREPGAREQPASQETSTNIVNGVTPRVCVTVKHPKRVKSIEERIKSGHPQLIDDDEEDEEEEDEEVDEYEQIEEESNAEVMPAGGADDTSLQCTSVKDLLEKYENGTIFSNTEEQKDFEEKPVQLEVSTESATLDASITESVPQVPEVNLNEEVTTPIDSVQEPTLDSVSEKSGNEEMSPMVAADSSSDLTSQEPIGETSTLDSSSDTSSDAVEGQNVAESSTSSTTEMLVVGMSENEVSAQMEETLNEPATSNDMPFKADVREFNSSNEIPSDSAPETQAKELEVGAQITEKECL